MKIATEERYMDKEHSGNNIIRQIMEGRAARICAVSVTVFLCVLTLLEFTALELEWEIPVLEVVSGEHSIWSEEYQREELALDDSKENELIVDSVAENTAMQNAGNETVQNAGEGRAADTRNTAVQNAGRDRAADAGNTAAQSAGKDKTADAGNTAAQSAGEDETADAGNTAAQSTGEEAAVKLELPYYIKINRKQNCITIYTQDDAGEYTVPYKAMICSTGLYNATPRGIYQISTKYLWRDLYGGVYGQYATRIHGGVLFHSVPYYRKSKNALCTDKYNKLGQQASMGCVRLTVEDAKWISEQCPEGTTVEIYDADEPGPLGKPEAIKIDTDSPLKGWDPTDPDMENPWRDISKDE